MSTPAEGEGQQAMDGQASQTALMGMVCACVKMTVTQGQVTIQFPPWHLPPADEHQILLFLALELVGGCRSPCYKMIREIR